MADHVAASDSITFSSLPPEIRLCIFESCPDIAAARNLASTCKAAYSTWLAFAECICDCILSRKIRCYSDAQAFAEAQTRGSARSSITYQEYFGHLIWNAWFAERACDLVIDYYVKMKDLSQEEQLRFLHVFYTAWKFVVLHQSDTTSTEGSPSAAAQFLESISIHDYSIIRALACFIFGNVCGLLADRTEEDVQHLAERLDEMPQGRERASIVEKRRRLLVHLRLLDWNDALIAIDKTIPERFQDSLPRVRLGMRVLLDPYQRHLVNRE
ncbi:MAG: hypothetical protein Q9213_000759 [Squamulea squamosa]